MLHGDPPVSSDRLVTQIADYLNEYDDGGSGWLAATSDLVLHIAEDVHLRHLLGMPDPCPNCPPSGPCGIRKTLAALGRHGHVVLRGNSPGDEKPELPHAFHVGIGDQQGGTKDRHLVLNPELMDPGSLAHIIGDVFLEWLHRGLHRVPATGSSRESSWR